MNAIVFSLNLFIILIIALINKKKYKRITRINFLYTLIWFVTLTITILNPLNLYDLNNSIYLYITCSLVLFNIFYYIFEPKVEDFSLITVKNKDIYNYKRIYILNLLAFIFVLPSLIHAIQILFSNGFDLSVVRNSIYLGIGNSGNDFQILLTRTFPAAIFSITSMFGAINLSSGEKKLLFLSIFDLIVYSITFGGRLMIFNFIIFYFSSLILQGYSIKYKNIKKMKYVLLFLIMITIFRFTSAVKFLEQIQLYFFSSLSYLSKMLNNPTDFGLNNKMYGYITFSSLFEPFILFGKLFFGWQIKVPSYYLNIYTQPFINIGKSSVIMLNNNCSFFYPFILDWGYIGIIIGPLLLLSVMLMLKRNIIRKRSYLAYNLLIYFYSVLLTSNMFYKLNGISSSLALIFIIICTKKIYVIKK